MNKIYLSDSGPKVSPAVYGFYRWDEAFVNASNMQRIVDLCLELGINTFDHADIYGGYKCENEFGRLIAEKKVKREDLVIFSKCGTNIPHPSKPQYRVRHLDSSAEHIRQSVENSLKQLRTDYLDVFLLNGLDPLTNIDETANALQNLKDSGKVKSIGIVNFSVFQHQLLSSRLRTPIVTNHIELNLLNTAAFDNGQIDYIKQRYMRPLAMAPLAEGKIAESTEKIPVLLRGKLEEIAEKYHSDFESIAVAWLVKLGALPLIGTMNENRIRNIVKAFDIHLDHQDWFELYDVARGK
ncbi:MAG: aldo/keto reductase [Chitinophagaceae bacterium]